MSRLLPLFSSDAGSKSLLLTLPRSLPSNEGKGECMLTVRACGCVTPVANAAALTLAKAAEEEAEAAADVDVDTEAEAEAEAETGAEDGRFEEVDEGTAVEVEEEVEEEEDDDKEVDGAAVPAETIAE